MIYSKMAIIEYKLGVGPLAVYIDSLWYNEIKQEMDPTNRGHLSDSNFVGLFKTGYYGSNKGYEVFATSVGSGTRSEFGTLLSKIDTTTKGLIDDEKTIKVFHENHRVISTGKHRLFLCGEFYSPKQLIPNNKTSELKKLFIDEPGNKVLSKELFIFPCISWIGARERLLNTGKHYGIVKRLRDR